MSITIKELAKKHMHRRDQVSDVQRQIHYNFNQPKVDIKKRTQSELSRHQVMRRVEDYLDQKKLERELDDWAGMEGEL